MIATPHANAVRFLISSERGKIEEWERLWSEKAGHSKLALEILFFSLVPLNVSAKKRKSLTAFFTIKGLGLTWTRI